MDKKSTILIVDNTSDLEKRLLNVNGSPVHLEKTLLNLMSNAMEAIYGSGTITIQTENRRLN